MTHTCPTTSSCWLHRWAALTVAATLVLLGLGSAVTNFKAGMADPVWPTAPTALLHSTPEQLADVRWVIEHSHRLAGYVVGCCAIVLAVILWLGERRRWVCWLGSAALFGVCVQGVIGGLRVTEHVRWGLELRIVHGCFAQVVFGMLVAVAVGTSGTWRAAAPADAEDRPGLRRASRAALGLISLQIVFGVILRHTYHPAAQRLHLLTAFAATAAALWLIWESRGSGERSLRAAGTALAVLLSLQLVLGVEAWMTQLGAGVLPEMLPVTGRRVAIRSAHVLGGSLVFAATLTAALLARREPVAVPGLVGSTARLEGAA